MKGKISIQAEGLQKKYGSVVGLREAKFLASEKEITTLVGPNGAGKTTTVRILTTFLKPSGGSAKVLGMDLLKDYNNIRKRISYLPQDYDVSLNLTPTEAISYNLMARGWSIGDSKARAKKWLEILDLWELRNRTCWTLSGGERRRVSVAITLASESELIFLDEPTTGLDVEIKHSIWKCLREMISDGISILLTTHDMNEAQMLSDKVVMINNGTTIAEDTPKNIVSSHPYKYRVIVSKSENVELSNHTRFIDLGDKVILYTKSRMEAVKLVEELSATSTVYTMSEVGLEDAYLYLVRGEN